MKFPLLRGWMDILRWLIWKMTRALARSLASFMTNARASWLFNVTDLVLARPWSHVFLSKSVPYQSPSFQRSFSNEMRLLCCCVCKMCGDLLCDLREFVTLNCLLSTNHQP